MSVTIGIPWKHLLSYCGLVDAIIRASDKDLPVLRCQTTLTFVICLIFIPKFCSLEKPLKLNRLKKSWALKSIKYRYLESNAKWYQLDSYFIGVNRGRDDS